MITNKRRDDMKIKVFGNDDLKEQVLRFQLKQHSDGSVSLQVVDSEGEEVFCGNLIHINVNDRDGVTFTRAHGVTNKIGLTLDRGRIVVE